MTIGIRILGLALLAFGITFLVWGINQSDTFANQFMNEMAGTYPEETKRYIFGGVAMIVVGMIVLSLGYFKRKKM